MKEKNIKIGISDERKVNLVFIETWHRAEKEDVDIPEERLYFMEPSNFFQVLSKRRIALLKVLHEHGVSSIRELSRLLKRDYKNVYNDVQLLRKAGLIHQDSAKRIYVPWDKIKAEIALAA